MEKLFVENLNNPLSFRLPWKVFLWGTYCDWRFGSFLDCQPLLILANWNPCSTWFHFHFSVRRWLECGFHSAPSCILIAFAYCTDHKCIKPGQNSQLMLQHVCTHICPHTHIRQIVMAIVYYLFIALLINCRLYLCQFFTHPPTSPFALAARCPFFWMTWGLANNTCKTQLKKYVHQS